MSEQQIADISVLISIFKNDNPEYFQEALDSIYKNQILKPNEIVLVADGAINNSLFKIINSFMQEYPGVMLFFQLEKNLGLADALNYGLGKCKNELVARMDSDDISHPHRFAYQYKFMKDNDSISVSGTYIEEVEPDTLKHITIRKVPLSHAEIFSFAKRRSPVSHPSVIFRRSIILQFEGYPSFRKSQDYALWSKLLNSNVQFSNISEVLLKMRTGRELQSRRGLSHFKYEYSVLKYQYKIGFISKFDFFVNFLIRFVLRATPVWMRRLFYSMR